MLAEIQRFVNWIRRRNPHARTWRDYGYDLKQFVAIVGDRPPGEITLHDIDRFVSEEHKQIHSSIFQRLLKTSNGVRITNCINKFFYVHTSDFF